MWNNVIINMRCPLFKLIGFVINIAVCGSANCCCPNFKLLGLEILSNAATNDSEMIIIIIVIVMGKQKMNN